MRRILEVEIGDIGIFANDAGKLAMGSIRIQLQSLKVPNAEGPEIIVRCGCEASGAMTVQGLERDLLAAAADYLNLFAGLTADELRAAADDSLARSAQYRNPRRVSDPEPA